MEYIKLGDIATYINGYSFKPSDWKTEGTPIVRIQNLTGFNGNYNYTDKEVDSKYKIKRGDILISWSASIGVYEWEGEDAFLNQHIFKVEFNKICINKQYFKYAVEQSLDKAIKFMHGSTMKHITKKYFDNILIPVPNLEQQEKIVKILNKAESLINMKRAQLDYQDELVKSRFVEMFGDPITNPMGWEKEKLNNLGELARGKSKYRPRNAPELLSGPYPLIQTGDISNSGIYLKEYKQTYSELGLKQSKMWNKGTLCITIAANIAKTSILTFDACFPDSVVGFVPNNKTNNIFVQVWFTFLQQILENSAPESAQKNINLKILGEQDVINPPIELQNQFSNFVTKVDKLKFEMEKSLKELENNFNSLMQKAFKGELF